MNFYFAPMEGITGYIYRNAHRKYFPGLDKYFSPFIQPNQNQCFHSREIHDVQPEHNEGVPLIPQILTNRADLFITTAKKLEQMGYTEINLNLGCPSKTVVSKMRGAGFLREPVLLKNFLDAIFCSLTLRISVKTRIGMENPEEFYDLIQLYNAFPISELIIHPRLQTDYYKNTPHMQVFADACRLSKNPICYNGDLFTAECVEQFQEQFPSVDTAMVGRGLLVNPGMVTELRSGVPLTKEVLRAFHDEIYQNYQTVMSGEKNVLFKMKELWFYLIHMFPDSEKQAKKIKKAEKLSVYETVVDTLFSDSELVSTPRK